MIGKDPCFSFLVKAFESKGSMPELVKPHRLEIDIVGAMANETMFLRCVPAFLANGHGWFRFNWCFSVCSRISLNMFWLIPDAIEDSNGIDFF